MNAWWSYFWPAIAAGLVIGAIAGSSAFRVRILPPKDRAVSREKRLVAVAPRKRMAALLAGCAATIVLAALWHGPLGAAGRFNLRIEREARQTLDNWEMYKVTARLHHGPLTRRLILAGPADDFQRSELVRIMGAIPGVSGARWSGERAGPPLIFEGVALSLLGFLFGLLLAYLAELRRRHNAQWTW
jgi:hypothetical protein